MALEVAVNMPHLPKGTLLDVSGVLVENGGKASLDEDAELSFVSKHQKAVKDKLGGNEFVKVTGTPKFSDKDVEKMFPAPELPEVATTEEGALIGELDEGGDNQ